MHPPKASAESFMEEEETTEMEDWLNPATDQLRDDLQRSVGGGGGGGGRWHSCMDVCGGPSVLMALWMFVFVSMYILSDSCQSPSIPLLCTRSDSYPSHSLLSIILSPCTLSDSCLSPSIYAVHSK